MEIDRHIGLKVLFVPKDTNKTHYLWWILGVNFIPLGYITAFGCTTYCKLSNHILYLYVQS